MLSCVGRSVPSGMLKKTGWPAIQSENQGVIVLMPGHIADTLSVQHVSDHSSHYNTTWNIAMCDGWLTFLTSRIALLFICSTSRMALLLMYSTL